MIKRKYPEPTSQEIESKKQSNICNKPKVIEVIDIDVTKENRSDKSKEQNV